MIRSTPYATICIRFPGIDRPPRRLSCRAAQRVRVTARLDAQSCAPSLLRCHRSDQPLECCVAADWPRYRARLARSDDAAQFVAVGDKGLMIGLFARLII